jgi:hypothetical protein
MTKAGPLDLLGDLAPGNGYDQLKRNTVVLIIGESLSVRILDLETLIRTKEEAGREKDMAVISILRRTLEEKNKKTK